MMVVFWIVLALVVLWLISGLVVFWVACRKTEPLPIHEPEKLYERLSKVHGDLVLNEGMVWIREHEPQEIRMESHDGLTLRGRWVKNPNCRGTVILFHGWRGCAETDLSPVFRYYHSLGMNLLFVDQRAQNGSTGKYVTFGVRESQDAAQWVEYHNRHLCRCPVILDGISMGASTVMMAMGRNLPENVAGVIADSGFTSPREIIGHVFRQVAHIPGGVVLEAVGLWCRILGKFDINTSALETTKDCRLPLLMIHGLEDRFVPAHMSQRIYEAYTGPKELILVEGAGHGMGYLMDKARCSQALEDFFHRALAGRILQE